MGSSVVACAEPRQMVQRVSACGRGGVPCSMPSSAGGGLVRSMGSCCGAAIPGWQVPTRRKKTKSPRPKPGPCSTPKIHLTEGGVGKPGTASRQKVAKAQVQGARPMLMARLQLCSVNLGCVCFFFTQASQNLGRVLTPNRKILKAAKIMHLIII